MSLSVPSLQSAIREEMDGLRRRQVELKAEIASQAKTIEVLKREKDEMAQEMKRLQRLAKDAERQRAAPIVVPTTSANAQATASPYEMITLAQKQVLSGQIMQRAYRSWKRRRAERAEREEAARRKALRAYNQGSAAGQSAAAAAASTSQAEPEKEKAMSPSQIKRVKERLKEKLRKEEEKKREKELSTAEELESRYVTTALAFNFGFRLLEKDGYGGLERLIGTPSPGVFNAMEREHADETTFHSLHVRNTTPKREFLYVTEMEVGELPDRRADATSSRQGWRLADFVACDPARAANLIREEVLALRLYTGERALQSSSA